MDVGFIILRHVTSKETNMYWNECIKCIRKIYHTNKIIIIDDNSVSTHLTENVYANTTIIASDFPGRAELLPYYYFYKLRPFEKAIILHDSVFIQKYINFDTVADVSFLWSFTHTWDIPIDEKKLIMTLDNKDILLDIFDSKNIWSGCFGAMSCITHTFLTELVNKYDFFKLLDVIKTRHDRMCFERIFGVLCFSITKVNSIFGNIHDFMPWGYSFNQYQYTQSKYIFYKNPYIKTLPIIKVWTGR